MKMKREICYYIPLLYTNTSYKNWWLTELSFCCSLTVQPSKLMNGYFLSFFVASRIPKISSATNAAKLIINSNAASIDKKMLLSLKCIGYTQASPASLTKSHRHTTFIGNSFSITYWVHQENVFIKNTAKKSIMNFLAVFFFY